MSTTINERRPILTRKAKRVVHVLSTCVDSERPPESMSFLDWLRLDFIVEDRRLVRRSSGRVLATNQGQFNDLLEGLADLQRFTRQQGLLREPSWQ